MTEINSQTLEAISKKEPGLKKQIMVSLHQDVWSRLSPKIDKLGIPAARYIYALIIDHLNDGENELNKTSEENLYILNNILRMCLPNRCVSIFFMIGNYKEYKDELDQYGISLKNDILYIENRHEFWQQELSQKRYSKLLSKISFCKSGNAQRWMRGKNKRCTTFAMKDILSFAEENENQGE
jgi:hypothetical protein